MKKLFEEFKELLFKATRLAWPSVLWLVLRLARLSIAWCKTSSCPQLACCLAKLISPICIGWLDQPKRLRPECPWLPPRKLALLWLLMASSSWLWSVSWLSLLWFSSWSKVLIIWRKKLKLNWSWKRRKKNQRPKSAPSARPKFQWLRNAALTARANFNRHKIVDKAAACLSVSSFFDSLMAWRDTMPNFITVPDGVLAVRSFGVGLNDVRLPVNTVILVWNIALGGTPARSEKIDTDASNKKNTAVNCLLGVEIGGETC